VKDQSEAFRRDVAAIGIAGPDSRALRAVVDLQACQTEASKDRGVGRYSEALAFALATLANAGRLDLRGGVDATLPHVDAVLAALDPACARQRVSAYAYPAVERTSAAALAASSGVAAALVQRHWSALKADVLHVSHVFEGYASNAVSPPAPAAAPGLLRSATLYDLIPLRFPDHYFADAAFKQWYVQRLAALRSFDHLLAISDASRADAIDLLGIEASRITTIHGGVDARFTPADVAPEMTSAFRRRYGLRSRYALYTAGDEYRKNLDGVVAGFADIPRDVRHDVQLVIVCALSERTRAHLGKRVRACGLAPDDVVVTGYVPPDDLVLFYRLCDAFVFPSLYEGLGLPVLEAMSCGAPVIGAEASGIGELIARSDAVFDPRKPADIGERLARVLADRDFAGALRRHGVLRAREFTWQRSASIAIEAWTEARQAMSGGTAVQASAIPRRRIAVFTPLPPCRSGVADYNAAFLPYVARHFDIDVFVDHDEVGDASAGTGFALYPHREFEGRASGYDAIVYDVGASEFHAYMLDYVARYPGVVVLHDAYLGGLYGYLEFHLGQPGRFGREMLHSHGPRARRYLAPSTRSADPVRDAMIDLPATRTVLQSAIGIVSHSPFNRDVANCNYPEGLAAPYRIVPQMVRVAEIAGDDERGPLRATLDFAADDFLVCTFGHVVWTKCGDLLLDAFGRSMLGRSPHARLVYVGELATDAFGDGLRRAIASHPFAERIHVTGYLDEPAYASYLKIADLAVQLRTHSRGGTPKGVLDCLAHGVGVVVNNDASYTDYPDDVVIKVPAEPSANALIHVFDDIAHDPALLKDVARRGRDYVQREHAPETVAARYAATLEEFMRRREQASLETAVVRVASAVNLDLESIDRRARAAGTCLHASLAMRAPSRRRVLIDVSHLAAGDHRTGIQRVVRSIVRALYRSDRAGFEPIAVCLLDGRLFVAQAWLEGEALLTPAEQGRTHCEVVPQWGDTLLMLDSSWERYAEFEPVFEAVRSVHGTVCTVVYDLLPIRFPQYWPDGASAWFEAWLRRAIAASDGLVCISRAVADELDAFVTTRVRDARPRIGHWRLGAEPLEPAHLRDPLSAKVAAATQASRTFLMVGTLEPRKNYALALDAMEVLWREGRDVNLCIVGKQGWLAEDVVARIQGHPESGERMHYLGQASDAELAHCYRTCDALLVASAGEGFGLPLVEAMQFGMPVIASDLPVFREVLEGAQATYFDLATGSELAAVLAAWLDRTPRDAHSAGVPDVLTWEQSAERLLDVVLEHRWYKMHGAPG
jgi:glycosyltransferase involved in cell wall biosynthesis